LPKFGGVHVEKVLLTTRDGSVEKCIWNCRIRRTTILSLRQDANFFFGQGEPASYQAAPPVDRYFVDRSQTL
jgi:hypothetical protein